jgi:hypothetical protein
VTEAVRKRRGSGFYLSEDTFDGIPVSMATHMKSESYSLKRGLEVGRVINEKFSSLDTAVFR